MYCYHQDLNTPDPLTRLFRFCPLEKLESLITTSSLYFRHITEYKDTDEGKHTILDVPVLSRLQGAPYVNEQREPFNNLYYVNCWTEGAPDDDRFWKEYAPGKDGVAIATYVGRIQCALYHDKENLVYISHIRYINRSTERTFKCPQWRVNLIEKCFTKGVENYSWEKEVRLLYIPKDNNNEKAPEGLLLPIDIDILIDSIFVSPYAEDSFIQKVKDYLTLNGYPRIPVIKASVK